MSEDFDIYKYIQEAGMGAGEKIQSEINNPFAGIEHSEIADNEYRGVTVDEYSKLKQEGGMVDFVDDRVEAKDMDMFDAIGEMDFSSKGAIEQTYEPYRDKVGFLTSDGKVMYGEDEYAAAVRTLEHEFGADSGQLDDSGQLPFKEQEGYIKAIMNDPQRRLVEKIYNPKSKKEAISEVENFEQTYPNKMGGLNYKLGNIEDNLVFHTHDDYKPKTSSNPEAAVSNTFFLDILSKDGQETGYQVISTFEKGKGENQADFTQGYQQSPNAADMARYIESRGEGVQWSFVSDKGSNIYVRDKKTGNQVRMAMKDYMKFAENIGAK